MSKRDEAWRKIHEGSQLVDEGRNEIMEGLLESIEEGDNIDTKMAELEESIDELKKMIMEQSQIINELRNK